MHDIEILYEGLAEVVQARQAEWRKDALCRGQTDVFFPTRGENHLFRTARKICKVCPVQEECREDATQIQIGIDHAGVWGGLTQKERKNIRLRKQLQRRRN